MQLVDSHCHLDPQYFPDGPDAAIDRAKAAGVVGFVVVGVGESLAQARAAIALAKSRADVVAAVGVHPHDAKLFSTMESELATLANESSVVAVGECGLDYHYNHSPADTQKAVFAAQIALARRVKKPIVVHTRSARQETLDILEAENARDVGGVIHCFSEDRAFATRAIDLGFYLSFSGIVTFKTAKDVQDVAAWAPLDRILVETDSPYLAPVPHRGKPCEPAYVAKTAAHVADLRKIALADLAAQCTQNTEKLFGRTFS